MTNTNIDLPSKRPPEFSMTEIEGRSLSRKGKKKDMFWFYFIAAFIVMMFLTGTYLLVGDYVDYATQRAFVPEAHAEEAIPNDNGYYCQQMKEGKYMADYQVFEYCASLESK